MTDNKPLSLQKFQKEGSWGHFPRNVTRRWFFIPGKIYFYGHSCLGVPHSGGNLGWSSLGCCLETTVRQGRRISTKQQPSTCCV